MKPLFFAFLLLAAAWPLRAEDWLANGDFTSGKDHWYGEARWPDDYAAPDPFTKADPLTASGMIIPLKSSSWMKEFQDFKGKGSTAELKITYKVAPDSGFSKQASDYQNVPDKIGWDAWYPFSAPVGSFVVFISELAQNTGRYYMVHPNMSSTGEQTFTATVNGMTPWSQKTIALAFPPGNGMIILSRVTMIDPHAP